MFKVSESNLLGIVVTFNPDIQVLISNINKYIVNVAKLIVWQNSVIDVQEKNTIVKGCKDSYKILFLGNQTNLGMSHALNEGLKYAINNGYQYYLTMDQDSVWRDFKSFLSYLNEISDSSVSVGGPSIINLYSSNLFANSNDCVYRTKDYVITSGAIYSVKMLQTIGGFQEDYFIDAVDEEICYRARSFGYKTVQITKSELGQYFGNYSETKIFGKPIACSNYTPFRYYYIARNHIWLIKSGYLNKREAKLVRHNYVFMPLLKVVLLETNKAKKIIAIIKGLSDGIFDSPREHKL